MEAEEAKILELAKTPEQIAIDAEEARQDALMEMAKSQIREQAGIRKRNLARFDEMTRQAGMGKFTLSAQPAEETRDEPSLIRGRRGSAIGYAQYQKLAEKYSNGELAAGVDFNLERMLEDNGHRFNGQDRKHIQEMMASAADSLTKSRIQENTIGLAQSEAQRRNAALGHAVKLLPGFRRRSMPDITMEVKRSNGLPQKARSSAQTSVQERARSLVAQRTEFSRPGTASNHVGSPREVDDECASPDTKALNRALNGLTRKNLPPVSWHAQEEWDF